MTYLLTARNLPVCPTVDTDVLSVTNHLFSSRVCRDRFNLLNRICNFRFDLNLAEPIPIPTSKSLSDIIDETATRIICENDKIVAMWSGGVDSTCLTSAFIKNGVNKSNFAVLCSQNSIKESPFFYEWLLKNQVQIIVTNNVKETAGNIECSILVTGCCADQLFGHAIHRKDYSLYNLDYIYALDLLYKSIGMTLSDRSLEMLKEYWKHYGRVFDLEIKEFCEFAWLYNFGVRFTLIRDSVSLQFALTQNKDKFYPFFAGYDFQCYAVSNFERLKDYNQMFDPIHYKQQIKAYTNSVIHDDRCLLVGKHMSNITNKSSETQIAVRTTNGIRVYHVDNNDYEKAGVAIGNQFRKNQVLL